MSIRIAFAGFRHGHINALYKHATDHPDCQIVAAAEEDADTRQAMADGPIPITHDCIDTMLAEVDCDAIAVGDVYARRGSILIRALSAGRHVIADKPICTDLAELTEIRALAESKSLSIGCQFDLRCHAVYLTLRRLIGEGAIGDILSISFTGQHPLSYGSRPMWYFEPGMHGGTINDIAVHGIDLLPWLTGLDYASVIAARSWNAKVPQHPHFDDGGQFMLTLSNGAGVMADVSYFKPDGVGFAMPQYWRFTIHGSGGVLEADLSSTAITYSQVGAAEPQLIPLDDGRPAGYLADFVAELAGHYTPGQITTAEVLRTAEVSLLVQKAGHQGLTDVDLG